jgi:hypothetical protein
MDKRILIFLIVVVIGVIGVMLVIKTRSGFLGFNDSVCGTHCVRNKHGKIMDVYDCCECKATVSNKAPFEPQFYLCMCNAGYNNYCYKPVANTLLSQ